MPKPAITQEERLLIKLVEKMHLAEEDKSHWIESIRDGNMSEELAVEIRQKLTETQNEPDEDEQRAANRMRNLTELAMLVKRWRFTQQSHN